MRMPNGQAPGWPFTINKASIQGQNLLALWTGLAPGGQFVDVVGRNNAVPVNGAFVSRNGLNTYGPSTAYALSNTPSSCTGVLNSPGILVYLRFCFLASNGGTAANLIDCNTVSSNFLVLIGSGADANAVKIGMSSTSFNRSGNIVLPRGKPYHVLLELQGSTAGRVWVDGENQSVVSTTTGFNSGTALGTTTIGNLGGGSGTRPFTGVIEEIRFYSGQGSDGLAKAIYRNPYDVFYRPGKKTWFLKPTATTVVANTWHWWSP